MSSNSYPGYVIPSSTIAVDYWPTSSSSSSHHITHYFLTHCHADHTKNLDSTWTGSYIYCSSLTKSLLIRLKQVNKDWIKELDINTTHIFKLDESQSFNVTLIDANHCPGAVMFLFESYFGCILATGDFRYKHDMLESIQGKEIDTCFLDNTYFNEAFSAIPTRQQALKEMIELVESMRRKNENLIVQLKMKKLGKENLLVEMSRYFSTHICVSTFRYETYTQVLHLNEKHFTTEFSSNTLFYLDDIDQLTTELDRMEEILKTKTRIQVEPTALHLIAGQRARQVNQSNNYFTIPYSDHSSYTELIEFVKELRPKKIVPIVRTPLPKGIDTTDITELNKYLNKRPLVNGYDEYRLFLKSTTSMRRSSRLNSFTLSRTVQSNMTNKSNKRRISLADIALNNSDDNSDCHKRPTKTRQVLLRNKKQKKQIEYETPEKNNEKETNNKAENTKLISRPKFYTKSAVNMFLNRNKNANDSSINSTNKENEQEKVDDTSSKITSHSECKMDSKSDAVSCQYLGNSEDPFIKTSNWIQLDNNIEIREDLDDSITSPTTSSISITSKMQSELCRTANDASSTSTYDQTETCKNKYDDDESLRLEMSEPINSHANESDSRTSSISELDNEEEEEVEIDEEIRRDQVTEITVERITVEKIDDDKMDIKDNDDHENQTNEESSSPRVPPFPSILQETSLVDINIRDDLSDQEIDSIKQTENIKSFIFARQSLNKENETNNVDNEKDEYKADSVLSKESVVIDHTLNEIMDDSELERMKLTAGDHTTAPCDLGKDTKTKTKRANGRCTISSFDFSNQVDQPKLHRQSVANNHRFTGSASVRRVKGNRLDSLATREMSFLDFMSQRLAVSTNEAIEESELDRCENIRSFMFDTFQF